MSRKYYREEIEHKWSKYKKVLKHSFIEDLDWYERELNELYLYKDNYSKNDIIQAKIIIEIIKSLENLCIDRQIIYLIDETLEKIKKKYPEFFDS